MSVRSLLLTGNLVNKKFAYYKVSKELDPFDEETYEKNNKDFYAVVTNIETGEAEYIFYHCKNVYYILLLFQVDQNNN